MTTTDLETRTRYDPGEVESRVLARWLESGLFHPEAAGTAEENYSIAIPLPNVTGALHMGHALNGSVQDALIRLARMRGKRTKWIFGTDHAGIGTQTLVERALIAEGTSREELGREKFTERVWRWRDQYGSTIVEQFKRLGASCDYEDERFTLDPRYVEVLPPNPDARVTIVVSIEDEDAEQLQRLATARRQRPGEVISSLLRSA